MKKLLSITAMLTLILTGCSSSNGINLQNKQDEDKQEENAIESREIIADGFGIDGEVKVFLSTNDQKYLFSEMEPIKASAKEDILTKSKVVLDYSVRYQEIDGFGASITDSSAYSMSFLTEDALNDLMTKLFDKENGINISYIRQTIGACDFSRMPYSYSMTKDMELSNFSIDYDKEQIIPLLKKALELNPDLKIMASPWSAPGWMKTTGSMIGGSLMTEYYQVYADYFVKYLQAYADEGIKINAITPQNEPLYVPPKYPGMSMSKEEQTAFINTALGPKVKKAFPEVKIYCYDHNWDVTDYARNVITEANEFVDGTAWHHYGGSPVSQTTVHFIDKSKETHFTEGSGGEWIPPFHDAFFTIIKEGIDILRNWSKSYILWNLSLDEKNGPFMPNYASGSTCRGIVKVNTQTGELTYNLDYFALAHFSKFIDAGAVRIESNNLGKIYTIACENTDRTTALVVYNGSPIEQTIKFVVGDSAFEYSMQVESVATFYFKTTRQ